MKTQTNSIVYSVPITKGNKGETPVYRNPKAVEKLSTHISRLPHVNTLQDVHDESSKEFSNVNCLGTRVKLPNGSLGPYEFKTYKAVNNIARQAGSSILNLDLAPIVHAEGYPDIRPIVIYEKNCEQWAILDIACCLYGITVVPIFDILGLEALQFIFKQTESTTIFTSGTNVDTLIQDGIAGKLFKLRTIVCLQGYTQAQKEAANKGNFQLISWEEFLDGGSNILPYPKVTPETIFTLGYTSGTTGIPKGAIITHGNIVAAIGATNEAEVFKYYGVGDVHLSYLPIAHIFERVCIHDVLSKGITIGFYGGDILKLSDDLQTLKPTFMISAPRLYNKFYAAIMGVLTKILQSQNKDPNILNLPGVPIKILQSLPSAIKDQIKAITGGRVRHYFSGSAPISPEVLQFLRVAFSAPILEGYGQTETCSGCYCQQPGDNTAGNIGGPYTNTEFKLVDIPEMNYTCQDKGPKGELTPRGELCLRGPSLYKGYYKEPEKTAESIDEEGWHHTGDIAMLLPNGSIKLIDRRKNIFKLSQGEYIAPEKIENIYLTNKYIAEAYVHGDSLQSEIVAIIVPDRDNLLQLGKELEQGDKTFEDLCKEPQIIQRIANEIAKTGQQAKLLKFELSRGIYLEPQSFALLGLTTPSMKLKRNIAREHFAQIITKLYNSINAKL